VTDAPPAPIPDDKDWTWVLQHPCPECGFDAASLDATSVAALVRANASTWAGVLGGDERELRQRPQLRIWSPLEYACHVRDVFRLYDWRLALMLREDDPLFPNWDQDETALAERYDLADPSSVRDDLVAAAEALASSFDAVTADQWACTGRRSDGASFTIDTFARYMIHDPIHHLWDVGAAR
jgi:hypothetical protein